jgi:hypothetical protein
MNVIEWKLMIGIIAELSQLMPIGVGFIVRSLRLLVWVL